MPSLYVIFARNAQKAVIFRRGPSKQVRLIGWDLASNTFEPGQWFGGRNYAEKSDLSPSGTRLIYYAATYGPASDSWIGLCTPPYLAAHAKWPAMGSWNIQSLFETNTRLALATYRSDSSIEPMQGFEAPRGLEVERRPWPGYFYVRPDHDRLFRDGWRVHTGDPVYRGPNVGKPLVYSKVIAGEFQIRTTIKPGGVLAHAIFKGDRNVHDLHADWADVHGGKLYFSHAGQLMITDLSKPAKLTVVADFTDMKFEEIVAPEWAMNWK